MKKKLLTCILSVSILVSLSSAHADDNAGHHHKTSHTDTHMLHAGDITIEAAEGLQIAGGITMVNQGTSGNDDGTEGDVIDASYSVDLEMSAPLGDNSTGFLLVESSDGDGLEGGELVSLWGVNNDAGDRGGAAELTEAWFEHYYESSHIKFTVGKLSISNYFDENEFANNETTQFLAIGFVNNIAIEFPNNGPGLRVNYSPSDMFSVTAGWQSGDGNWEDITRDSFLIGEVGVSPGAGNYRAFYWINQTPHTSVDDPTQTSEDASGFGVSLDQQIGEVGLFARYGSQSDDLTSSNPIDDLTGSNPIDTQFNISSALSFGVSASGALWGRNNDKLSIAYGIATLSDTYTATLETAGKTTGDETSLEVYYNAEVNDNVSVTPDVQLLSSANGDDDAGSILVAGVRLQIVF